MSMLSDLEPLADSFEHIQKQLIIIAGFQTIQCSHCNKSATSTLTRLRPFKHHIFYMQTHCSGCEATWHEVLKHPGK